MGEPYRRAVDHGDDEIQPVEGPPQTEKRISETQVLVAVLAALAIGLVSMFLVDGAS